MNNMRKYRKEKKFTLQQVAKQCNLTAGYISRLERDIKVNPSYKSMKRIAKALDKNVSEVFEI